MALSFKLPFELTWDGDEDDMPDVVALLVTIAEGCPKLQSLALGGQPDVDLDDDYLRWAVGVCFAAVQSAMFMEFLFIL